MSESDAAPDPTQDSAPDAIAPLVLGPMLRYIGETDATVWVETSVSGVVTVHVDGRDWTAPTFVV